MSDDVQELGSLDRLVHEPARLMILSLLAGAEHADFVFLARETGLTKGNLSAHLTRLEAAGYVEVEKRFRGRIPLTVCRLTAAGRAAFDAYVAQLRRFVDAAERPRGVRGRQARGATGPA
jgi:DNA-binding transcriptional ArsR family regulator